MDHARACAGTLETSPAADNPLASLVAHRGVVVLDGGLATQLEAQGNDLADPLWSARLLVENPGEITRAHLAFFRAGAAIATTASYQATFEGFAARGIDHAAAISLLQRSVALAAEARAAWRAERSARDSGPLLVAASIGPYGASLADGAEYRGRYGRSSRSWSRRRPTFSRARPSRSSRRGSPWSSCSRRHPARGAGSASPAPTAPRCGAAGRSRRRSRWRSSRRACWRSASTARLRSTSMSCWPARGARRPSH